MHFEVKQNGQLCVLDILESRYPGEGQRLLHQLQDHGYFCDMSSSPPMEEEEEEDEDEDEDDTDNNPAPAAFIVDKPVDIILPDVHFDPLLHQYSMEHCSESIRSTSSATAAVGSGFCCVLMAK